MIVYISNSCKGNRAKSENMTKTPDGQIGHPGVVNAIAIERYATGAGAGVPTCTSVGVAG